MNNVQRLIKFYDTTLRDGSQAEGISFSVQDKIRICQLLDEWGIDYIEGGWPGSNPKDIAFFQEMQQIPLKHAKLTAFGSTAHPNNKIDQDANLLALIASKVPACAIFGKSWDFHVTDALNIPLDKNLQMIEESVRYLTSKDIEVIFDAEHFFDGYKANPDYALKAVSAALEGGAVNISLCDTNGGSLPFEVAEISREVFKKFGSISIGAHCHNDSGTATANSIALVHEGGDLVQGTINGIGERCGNADLIVTIPNLLLKMGYQARLKEKIGQLSQISWSVSEIANMIHNDRTPFVGKSAFAHKGGIHVSAVNRNPKTYEHIAPEQVGNHRRVLVSELSGKSNILFKAEELDIGIRENPEYGQKIVKIIKDREHLGYHYEGAEASLELLVRREVTKDYKEFFKLRGYRVIVERHPDRMPLKERIFEAFCEATIKIEVAGQIEHTAAEGNGPVQALDNALKKALRKFYTHIDEINLTDYKVRVIDEQAGTGSSVRVLIDHQRGDKRWSTIGVDPNIITASWLALVDGVRYYLLKYEQNHKDFLKIV